MSQSKPLHFRLCLASPGGFEPLTPRLGGECSIQLSYEDMSDFWLKIGLSATFQAFGSVTGYSITYAFWMNCSIQLSSIHSPLVASYITLTLTDSNYRVLFPIVQRRQASPFLRRRTLYPAELQKHMHHMHFTAGRNSYGPQYIITYIGKKIKPQISKFPASTPGL
ncbi:MAG: hypothetical protein ENTB_02502 [Enterocloster aldenensis]